MAGEATATEDLDPENLTKSLTTELRDMLDGIVAPAITPGERNKRVTRCGRWLDEQLLDGNSKSNYCGFLYGLVKGEFKAEQILGAFDATHLGLLSGTVADAGAHFVGMLKNMKGEIREREEAAHAEGEAKIRASKKATPLRPIAQEDPAELQERRLEAEEARDRMAGLLKHAIDVANRTLEILATVAAGRDARPPRETAQAIYKLMGGTADLRAGDRLGFIRLVEAVGNRSMTVDQVREHFNRRLNGQKIVPPDRDVRESLMVGLEIPAMPATKAKPARRATGGTGQAK